MYQSLVVRDPNITVEDIHKIMKYMNNGVAFVYNIYEPEHVSIVRALTVSVESSGGYCIEVTYEIKNLDKKNFTKLLCKGMTTESSPYGGDIKIEVEFWEI
jgi:hypothetical protein